MNIVDSYVSVVAALCSVVVLKMFLRAANKEEIVVWKEREVAWLVFLLVLCVLLNLLPFLILVDVSYGYGDWCMLFSKSIIMAVGLRIGLLYFNDKQSDLSGMRKKVSKGRKI